MYMMIWCLYHYTRFFWNAWRCYGWGMYAEKELIIGKILFKSSRKNDVYKLYETDYIHNFYDISLDHIV